MLTTMLTHSLKKALFALFFLTSILFADSPFYYFIPPENWECADPKNLSSHVEVGFFGKGEINSFRPSINLASEEIGDLSLKEYLKAVKEIHESDGETEWRDLGPFRSSAGLGHLTEIVTLTKWGKVKMLQFILTAHKKAFVITGAMLKEDFALFRNPIVKAIRSLTFTNDLIGSITDSTKKAKLQEIYKTIQNEKNETALKEAADQFQEIVLNGCSEMGMHWQIVLLQNTQKMFSSLKND